MDRTTIERIAVALNSDAEAADLDFKQAFDPKKAGDWIALLKDIVAFANSGGGVILVGLNDEGKPSRANVDAMLETDPADFINQIHKYTGVQFAGVELAKCEKDGAVLCAIAVHGSRIPLVFTRPGTYEIAPGKQKTEFSSGTVYFRHGAKSEPGTTDDLRSSIEREIEAVRRSWLEGITKVVKAPTGARIEVRLPDDGESGKAPDVLRLTSDESAPPYYAVPIDKTHPHRQKEAVREINARMGKVRTVTSHDILCVRKAHEIENNIEYCYKMKFNSPRYSDAFVEWIVLSFQADNQFFAKAKDFYDNQRR